ncbi:MAG: hypothetical protein COA41_14635 [Sphingopyxis sp.]|nr:MAG: hypothetical protein COA41_14635 [Sphingopyxis sp.]
MAHKEFSGDSFTASGVFIFCDLWLKAAEYGKIGGTRAAPSVTFQTSSQKALVSRGREAGETHHAPQHSPGAPL